MHYRIQLHERMISDLKADSFGDKMVGTTSCVQFYRGGETVLVFPLSSLVSIERIPKPKTKDNA